MAGELLHRRSYRWPPFSDWFEDFPLEFRSRDEHLIRIEESEDDGAYIVRAELPGIDPDKDVEITVADGLLTVHAERTEEKKDKRHSEFRYGSFTRSIRLPAGVNEQGVTATYDNGVLTVKAPLVEVEKQARRIEIARGE